MKWVKLSLPDPLRERIRALRSSDEALWLVVEQAIAALERARQRGRTKKGGK
jgi:hypothetical protein